MNRLLSVLFLMLGLAALIIGILAWNQFQRLASASAAPGLEQTPMVNIVAGDLLQPAKQGNNVQSAELASRISTRIFYVWLVGIVSILIGFTFTMLAAVESRKRATKS